jgi:hypothetical protein
MKSVDRSLLATCFIATGFPRQSIENASKVKTWHGETKIQRLAQPRSIIARPLRTSIVPISRFEV